MSEKTQPLFNIDDAECAKAYTAAQQQAEMGARGLAKTLLSQYDGCNHIHKKCPYRGDMCPVDKLLHS